MASIAISSWLYENLLFYCIPNRPDALVLAARCGFGLQEDVVSTQMLVFVALHHPLPLLLSLLPISLLFGNIIDYEAKIEVRYFLFRHFFAI